MNFINTEELKNLIDDLEDTKKVVNALYQAAIEANERTQQKFVSLARQADLIKEFLNHATSWKKDIAETANKRTDTLEDLLRNM